MSAEDVEHLQCRAARLSVPAWSGSSAAVPLERTAPWNRTIFLRRNVAWQSRLSGKLWTAANPGVLVCSACATRDPRRNHVIVYPLEPLLQLHLLEWNFSQHLLSRKLWNLHVLSIYRNSMASFLRKTAFNSSSLNCFGMLSSLASTRIKGQAFCVAQYTTSDHIGVDVSSRRRSNHLTANRNYMYTKQYYIFSIPQTVNVLLYW